MGPTRSRPANVIDPLGLFGVGRLGHHIGLPSLEDASDTAAGFGDGAFGLTRKIRQALDVDNVNRCSAAYAGGNIVGTIAAGSWGLASRCSAMASTPGSPSRNGERGRAQVGSRSNCTSEPKRPFYVVHGELALWLDGDALVAGSTATRWCAGRGRMCWCEPAGRTRSWDPRDRPATYLTVMSPAGYEKYLVDLAKGLRHAAADKDAATPPTSAGS